MSFRLRQFSFPVVFLTFILSANATVFSQEAYSSAALVPTASLLPGQRAQPSSALKEEACQITHSLTGQILLKISRAAFCAPADEAGSVRLTGRNLNRQTARQSSVNSARQRAELSAGEKIRYGLKRTFFRPQPYLLAGLSDSLAQLRERDQPQKDTGDKMAHGLSRYAIAFATSRTRTFLVSGLYPAIFHEDPRYKPSGRKGFKARALYAATRVFVTEDSSGHLRPNYSRPGGSLTASALANYWERNTPGHERIGVAPTFRRFGRMIGFDVLQFIVLKEFGPDIRRRIFGK
jgi:hypothetical protein